MALFNVRDLVVVVMVASASVGAQTTAKAARIERSLSPCVLKLAIPSFGPIAYLGAASDAPIVTTIAIGDRGVISQIIFSHGADIHHQNEIEEVVRQSSFNPICSGRLVEVVFSYKIMGSERFTRQTRIEFMPPNSFVIITNPLKANVDQFYAK